MGWKSCISVVFCFRLVFLSVCLNTTQYTTLNTNKLEMGLFITCVKCSKQCSNSSIKLIGRTHSSLELTSLFKLLLEHNTIHYTKHKQTNMKWVCSRPVSNVQRLPNIITIIQHTTKTCFRVCLCIIAYKCDRFACTP